MGGSTLELWTNRLEGLEISEVHVLDRDVTPPGRAKYQDAADRVNARGNNCSAFITNRREMENYIHFGAINEEFDLELNANFTDFDDVPNLVAKEVHERSESTVDWLDVNVKKRSNKVSQAKRRLNRGAIDNMTAERLTEIDTENEVRAWLRQISHHLT